MFRIFEPCFWFDDPCLACEDGTTNWDCEKHTRAQKLSFVNKRKKELMPEAIRYLTERKFKCQETQDAKIIFRKAQFEVHLYVDKLDGFFYTHGMKGEHYFTSFPRLQKLLSDYGALANS